MQWLFDKLMIIIFYLFRIFPIQNNKIVISSYLGKGYGDNPKYIVEELLRKKRRFDIVWLTKDISAEFPKGVRGVNYRSLKSIYELCTARIWIDNRRKPIYVRKRSGQFYIMTWHGYLAIKKVEKDVETKLEARYVKAAKRDSKMIDVFISGSKWETECISSVFWYDGKILNIGYPRSDILLKGAKKTAGQIRKYYGLSDNDRILLYAPTFRHSKDEGSLSAYNIEWSRVLETLSEKFGGNWIGMIRLHPNVSKLADKLNLPDKVINVTSYNDMQELIAACECMITDYSSSIMDAGIAGKIGFIYAADYADYEKDRDVYFNIKEDLPFMFSETNNQLADNIRSFESDKYYRELGHFLKDTYGVFSGGDASEKICKIIEEVTNRG